MARSPAIDTAKKNGHIKLNEPITLTTGIQVQLKPVPITAIQDAQSQIVEPQVPMQEIPGKDGLYENPTDPDYVRKRAEVFNERVRAGFDVMAIMGIELLGGLPEDNTWLKKLKFLSKRGHLNLDDYDLEDEFELEFLYKRYVVMGNDDWMLLSQISGISEEDIAQAKDSFPGN